MFIVLNKLRKFPPTFPAGRSNCRETLHFLRFEQAARYENRLAGIEKYYIATDRKNKLRFPFHHPVSKLLITRIMSTIYGRCGK